MKLLLIKPCDGIEKTINEFYSRYEKTHSSDSGLDIKFPETLKIPPKALGFTIHLGIECEMIDQQGNNIPYMLVPRSSIGKTPIIMANSIGIIDKTYRGELMAKVHNLSDQEFVIKKGEKLFQIVQPSLNSFDYKLVTKLSDTKRGKGGFGSTNY